MFKIIIGISALSFIANPIIGPNTFVEGVESQIAEVNEIARYDSYETNRHQNVKPTIVVPPPPPTIEELFPLESLPADWPCKEWFHMSLKAGWTLEDWPKLGKIMFRESRCLPDACGETDSPHVRKCRDWGLLQINDYSWKRTIRGLGMDIYQMWDPYWNLWFGRWLYNYSLERNDDGWQPWKFPPK